MNNSSKYIRDLCNISQNSCANIIRECLECPLFQEYINKKMNSSFRCMMNSKEHAKEELSKYTEEEIFEALL